MHKNNDLTTRSHKKIGDELVFSGRVHVSSLLLGNVIVLVNKKETDDIEIVLDTIVRR